MSDEKPTCEVCGEPMQPGEEMFKYHGSQGPCPKPPLPRPPFMIEGRNIDEAAKRVADMNDEDVKMYALRDPDIFRHIALAYRAKTA